MSELKPCPFCGGEVAWCDSTGETHNDGSECHLILCLQCGAEFDMAGISNPETIGELKKICADKYNTRADEPCPKDCQCYKAAFDEAIAAVELIEMDADYNGFNTAEGFDEAKTKSIKLLEQLRDGK